MISLGGGGQHFTLADPKRVPNFVSSVTRIVADYGFDGIDIDFESPSLSIDPGDTDFQHPTTPSIVNLISAMRQLHDHFGAGFMISLVPEGTQIPAGYPSYGGQFGSYLPILYAIRDILSFVDVQDYNTPPLEGLDGEIYQPGTVDYHAAMTELLLHGFQWEAIRAVLSADASRQSGRRLSYRRHHARRSSTRRWTTSSPAKLPAATTYKLRQPRGYPGMIGAMFWTIDADRREAIRSPTPSVRSSTAIRRRPCLNEDGRAAMSDMPLINALIFAGIGFVLFLVAFAVVRKLFPFDLLERAWQAI